MSKKTLLLGSIILVLTAGAAENERARLEEEIASERNALDAFVLKPGMKLDDPRVREKAAALEEKVKRYHTTFEGTQSQSSNSTPVAEKSESPVTALSGEGIQKEITYPKKNPKRKQEKPLPKLPPRFDHSEEAVPVATQTPNAEGVSEIQYSKKKKRNSGP